MSNISFQTPLHPVLEPKINILENLPPYFDKESDLYNYLIKFNLQLLDITFLIHRFGGMLDLSQMHRLIFNLEKMDQLKLLYIKLKFYQGMDMLKS